MALQSLHLRLPLLPPFVQAEKWRGISHPLNKARSDAERHNRVVMGSVHRVSTPAKDEEPSIGVHRKRQTFRHYKFILKKSFS